ncbi:MAG TPA: prepilin-type N-terminal cleavage/methylation domain-containing protein, partial [Phycisphaerae bacterium]|nr:prepilin-type N-terminal cleavage/methylation domain-containing protein [Phycisphaerae bacterium]
MMVHKTDGVARGVPTGEGFTLIEVAIATAIIAIGVVALVVSVGSGTRANQGGTELTQAVFLAQEIREWTLRLP